MKHKWLLLWIAGSVIIVILFFISDIDLRDTSQLILDWRITAGSSYFYANQAATFLSWKNFFPEAMLSHYILLGFHQNAIKTLALLATFLLFFISYKRLPGKTLQKCSFFPLVIILSIITNYSLFVSIVFSQILCFYLWHKNHLRGAFVFLSISPFFFISSIFITIILFSINNTKLHKKEAFLLSLPLIIIFALGVVFSSQNNHIETILTAIIVPQFENWSTSTSIYSFIGSLLMFSVLIIHKFLLAVPRIRQKKATSKISVIVVCLSLILIIIHHEFSASILIIACWLFFLHLKLKQSTLVLAQMLVVLTFSVFHSLKQVNQIKKESLTNNYSLISLDDLVSCRKLITHSQKVELLDLKLIPSIVSKLSKNLPDSSNIRQSKYYKFLMAEQKYANKILSNYTTRAKFTLIVANINEHKDAPYSRAALLLHNYKIKLITW